jgi:hypothetical protein
MSSAAACLPPPPGFLRVYHFVQPKYALETISLARLKVTRFSEANDPFELMALRIGGKSQKTAVLGYRDAFDGHTGMLCFSRNWSSPVLWSHYADRHRGICLGFNLARHLAKPVQYESARIPLKLQTLEDFEALEEEEKHQLFSTKFTHWSYEAEVRQFVRLEEAPRDNDLHFWPFGQSLSLAEVVVGASSTLFDEVQTLASRHHPHAITFQARLAIHSFNIVPKEKTVP